jgi:hypothetical protein
MKPNNFHGHFLRGWIVLSLLAIFFTVGCQTAPRMLAIALPGFQPAPFDEQTISYAFAPEVKIHINAPQSFPASRKMKLIFYALPNGNTTAQTMGRLTGTNDDWHFNIQHIAAQTRFLRQLDSNEALVVVYLEANQRSWPTWRKKHADQPELILQMVAAIKEHFHDFDVRVTLSAHSGGGSEIFGFINAEERIPNDVERIAFLDSNYGYDESLHHKEKLLAWLHASGHHYLSVLAYNDAVALLNGTNFVSAAGGTWGRSHAMLKDFDPDLKFTSETNTDLGLETYTALNGQVKFLLKENPDKLIFHTVQVERNGFIQSLLSGTPLEGRGYIYFGPRAYTNWIGIN